MIFSQQDPGVHAVFFIINIQIQDNNGRAVNGTALSIFMIFTKDSQRKFGNWGKEFL